MNLKHELEVSKTSYLKEWEYTSEYYHEMGYYDLLTESLPKDLTVLEIGCGAGHSTLSLTPHSKLLISIDENNNCIERTHTNLISAGLQSAKYMRSSTAVDDESLSFRVKYSDLDLTSNNSIHLVEGDILNDDSLINTLFNTHQFDLITCWMIGGHDLLLNNEHQLRKGRTGIGRTPLMVQEYKFEVLEQVAQLSSKLLKTSGIFSVAERMNIDIAQQFTEEQILRNFHQYIEPHGLIQANNYEMHEINTRSKMAMVTPFGKTDANKFGLLNLQYKKVSNML